MGERFQGFSIFSDFSPLSWNSYPRLMELSQNSKRALYHQYQIISKYDGRSTARTSTCYNAHTGRGWYILLRNAKLMSYGSIFARCSRLRDTVCHGYDSDILAPSRIEDQPTSRLAGQQNKPHAASTIDWEATWYVESQGCEPGRITTSTTVVM